MTRRLRPTLAALGASAVLLVATGCGTSTSSTATSAASGSAPTQQQAAGGPGMMNLTTLATKLGVSESKLRSAMQAARPQQGAKPQDMAATLAKKLGLSTATVRAALKQTMPSGTPPQGAGAPRSGQQNGQTT